MSVRQESKQVPLVLLYSYILNATIVFILHYLNCILLIGVIRLIKSD